MKFTTRPGFVINRGWEAIIADSKWIIETDNKEAIEVLNALFPSKTVKWKSEAKK